MKAFLTTGVFLFLSVQVFAQISPVMDTAIAYRLIREGDAYFAQNQKKQSCESYKQALKLMSLEWDAPKTARCLRQICSFYDNTAEFDSLIVYAERGYQITLQLQAAGHTPVEDFCRFKANYYRQKSQFSESLYWYKKNSIFYRQYFPDSIFDLADSYKFLGILYYHTGHIDSAILMFTENLSLLAKLPQDDPKTQSYIASCLQNRGTMYKELGNDVEAISSYEQALAMAKTLSDEALSSKILYNMALVFEVRGDLDRALDHLQKAGDILSKIDDDNTEFYARLLGGMAAIQTKRSNFNEASVLFQKSLAINLAKFGPDHYEIGINKMNLSYLMLKLGRNSEALQSARESVGILEKVFPAPHPRKVEAYITLVYCFSKHGIYNDSLVYYSEKSISDVQELYGVRNELASQVWHARCLALLGFPGHEQEALEAVQEALIVGSRLFDNRDIRQNPALDDFFNEESRLSILTSKAAILASIWQTEKQPEQLKLALQCLEDGNTTMQYFLRRYGDQGGIDYMASEPYGLLCKDGIEFGTTNYKAYPNAENLDRCFLWMERDKAQKLLLATQNAYAKKFAGLPDSLLQQDAELAQQLARLEKNLLDAEAEKDSVAIAQIRDEQLFDAKNKRHIFVKELESNYPNYFSLKYQATTVDLRKVQALLSADHLVLEIALERSSNDSSLFLFAITHTSQKLLKVPQQKGLSDKITRLNSLLQNPSLAQDSRRKEFNQISSELYQQFIQPIEDQLTGIKKIIIIGEGITHLLPFEVLVPKNLNKPFQQLDFLIRHFEISYHYSATLWASSPKSKPQFKQDLLAFAPVFDSKDDYTPLFRGPVATAHDSTLRAFTTDGNWTALPWTEKEVKNIAQHFKSKGKVSVKLLMREQANEKSLKIGLEQGARCIHIASHSFANLQNPKFSGIACYPDKHERLDGTLYVGEIYNLGIPADLVVLSSCESGRGKLLRAEGPLGLNRAFLYAGAPNVLFTLWKINDRATADFFNYFYPAMLQGQSYSEALRSAKLKMLANPATALPIFWSGFLLIGK
ncbi:MAG: CHAT domain-containing protein [Saprospiraceae bacterium]|nr:CHAT domain-containing protein [Saprospiraceae bacterium]